VFAAEEDFGIVLVEAQACGTPVIAFGRGGAAEIVRASGAPEPTGVFFAEQTPEAIRAAVEQFEHNRTAIAPQACRKNAERFGIERFRSELTAYILRAWDEFRANPHPAPRHGKATQCGEGATG
jgi:glycosyltransferase involved in cell wall biosynthesis